MIEVPLLKCPLQLAAAGRKSIRSFLLAARPLLLPGKSGRFAQENLTLPLFINDNDAIVS
jgi:hypothetical protein